jgi:aminobenzoyl-glutamate transport protein
MVVAIAALALPAYGPPQNPTTGSLIGESPFMDRLIVLFMLAFLATGLAYAAAPRPSRPRRRSWLPSPGRTPAWEPHLSVLGHQLVPRPLQLQQPGDGRRDSPGAAAIAKWAILTPIFNPLFLKLDVAPKLVLAAYCVGDSPMSVLTPLMPYFGMTVVFAQRCQRGRCCGRGDDAAVRCGPVSYVDRSDGSLVSARHTPRRVAQPHIAAATIIRRAA